MARKKIRVDTKPVLFDVVYEDGTRTSNRKVFMLTGIISCSTGKTRAP